MLAGTVAFTGRLASMKRADAFALVRSCGGTPRDGVTKDTNVLVVGELGWPLMDDGQPSKSLARAKSYRLPIASERQFLRWLGKFGAEAESRTYTGEQLASLSKLPGEVVDQLSMFGLIEAHDLLYGFRDLAAARQVASLLRAGTPLSVVTRSLHDIRKWLPDARLSNLRLFPKSSDRILIEHVNGRTDQAGQFLLDVDAAADDVDTAFAEALAAEENDEIAVAERLYRKVMRIDPSEPAAAFNLGNILRAAERHLEAETAFRAAVKADPQYALAWFNLADVLDEQHRTKEAVECLKRALDADPSYVDAAFNMALFLQRLERHAEAVECWKQYLKLDGSSPWAMRARRALKFCEIHLVGSAS